MGKPKPIHTPLAVRARDLLQGPLTIAVWLGCLTLALLLFQRRAVQHPFTGIARAREFTVAAPLAGTIEEVLVRVYDHVDAHQPLALLDAENLEASLRTARGIGHQLALEVEAARVALGTAAAQAQAEWQAELRSFYIDEQALRLRGLELSVVLEAQRIKQVRWDLRLNRTAELAASALVPREALDEQRLRLEELVSEIRHNETLLANVERELAEAVERRAAFESERAPGTPVPPENAGDPRASLLGPLRESIRVQELRVEELQLQRHGLVLRAPVDGFVTQLPGHPGRVIAAGEPVAVVVDPSSSDVIGFLPPTHPRSLAVGDELLVSRMDGSGAEVRARVQRASPAFELLPQQLWINADRPSFGRPVVLDALKELDLLPGEQLLLRRP